MKRSELESACALLAAGHIIALPTETVYGLAVDPRQPAALARLFALKQRPPAQPVSLLAADADMLSSAALQPDAAARLLAQTFWPGPLTLIVRATTHCPWHTTADGGRPRTVGIRVPDHAVAQTVLQYHGGALAVSSANRSGAPSLLSAAAVANHFGTAVGKVIDGGNCALGTASTVVDCSTGAARIVRSGALEAERIGQALAAHGLHLAPTKKQPSSA